MSAIADRPEDNNDGNNKKFNLPSFNPEDKPELPIEKQLVQWTFVSQLDGISLEQAKQLLTELHFLYLCQQHFVTKIAKQEFLGKM